MTERGNDAERERKWWLKMISGGNLFLSNRHFISVLVNAPPSQIQDSITGRVSVLVILTEVTHIEHNVNNQVASGDHFHSGNPPPTSWAEDVPRYMYLSWESHLAGMTGANLKQ